MNLLQSKKVFIFDLDGTVYKGDTVIPGAKMIIDTLQKSGKFIFLLTNNASKSRVSFVKKLKTMKIQVIEDQIISSGYIAALKLAREPYIKSVFVIGTSELIDMIEKEGTTTLNNRYNTSELLAPFLDPAITCDAVLTSLDHEFTYAKIRTAMELINRGADFYATNGDTTFPEHGQLWPGGGVMLAAVQACVGIAPKEVFGKPNTLGLEMIYEMVQYKGVTLEDLILIGDRFETDILQANRMGIDSVFVETGVNVYAELEKIEDLTIKEQMTPTYKINSIENLLD